MSCLEHILHAVTGTRRAVLIRVSTLRERATAPLRVLRPDLDLRGQIKAWASLNGLVATWDRDECWVTFHPAAPENDQTRMRNDELP